MNYLPDSTGWQAGAQTASDRQIVALNGGAEMAPRLWRKVGGKLPASGSDKTCIPRPSQTISSSCAVNYRAMQAGVLQCSAARAIPGRPLPWPRAYDRFTITPANTVNYIVWNVNLAVNPGTFVQLMFYSSKHSAVCNDTVLCTLILSSVHYYSVMCIFTV